jgi:protein-L-isoaspartate(D-aspartate) O-methyltransferase
MKALVDNLIKYKVIKSQKVADIMTKVDRKNFVVDPIYAYADCPQGIKYGATISAPHMHAYALVIFRNPNLIIGMVEGLYKTR